MFVDGINIREFRGIKGCKKPLEFSKLNILIGRNNAGKTTILEALSLLPQPNSPDPIIGESKIDVLSSLHDSKPNQYEYLLYFYTGEALIEYYLKNKEFSILLSKRRPEVFLEKKRIRDEVEIRSFFNTKNLRNLVIYIPFDSKFLNDMEKKIEVLKYEINKEGFNVKLATTINTCLDDKYSEIMFQDKIILRKILGENKFNYVNLKDLGSGAKKVIKIMALVEVLKPKLLLIDDFEAGLHPSLIDIFLNWINDKKLQTIVSTHSIDVLYRLTEIDPEDTKILFLKKSQDDILQYNEKHIDEIEDFLNANTDPRRLNL
ncbi:hypothetical protein LCGC14_1158720 [marine sediment metagenome]|uniref:ATPase AAA-type core domain-containing protein n=1 Tax=marine sediment metagenome TaxID=412755 RepID=A0A0F9LYD0_9ZZZZ|nr:DUF2813 domain-containing protein [bacterium]